MEPVACIKCAHCSQLHEVEEGNTVFCESQLFRTADIPPAAECWWGCAGELWENSGVTL